MSEEAIFWLSLIFILGVVGAVKLVGFFLKACYALLRGTGRDERKRNNGTETRNFLKVVTRDGQLAPVPVRSDAANGKLASGELNPATIEDSTIAR